ncbi:MAG: hypothetical protein WAT39_22970 [Planctomycetota bacterium]
MKANATPIPVRSVVCLPRWLVRAAVAVCIVLLLGCLGLVTWGALFVDESGRRWGAIGGGLGGAIGCLGGLWGTLNDWRRRLPATVLLRHVQHDAPLPFYTRVFWPALAAFVLGIVLGCIFQHRAIWHGLVQTGGMLAFISGCLELVRRHTTKQARALFALYADGALAPEDAAAIDDARQKDAKFDAEVREFQALGERVRELTAGN